MQARKDEREREDERKKREREMAHFQASADLQSDTRLQRADSAIVTQPLFNLLTAPLTKVNRLKDRQRERERERERGKE